MAEYEKAVRKKFKEDGCYFVRRGRGDHDIWYSPITDSNVTVDGKINSRHAADAIDEAVLEHYVTGFQTWEMSLPEHALHFVIEETVSKKSYGGVYV